MNEIDNVGVLLRLIKSVLRTRQPVWELIYETRCFGAYKLARQAMLAMMVSGWCRPVSRSEKITERKKTHT